MGKMTELRTSPEPMDPENHGYSNMATVQESPGGHSRSEPLLTESIRHNSAPILHHIAPALGAPFMRAQGLVHRGTFPRRCLLGLGGN